MMTPSLQLCKWESVTYLPTAREQQVLVGRVGMGWEVSNPDQSASMVLSPLCPLPAF